ncbi:hypothetical protein HPB47_010497 [Ixodes persulcatus]|uniref:Uncharacterized protein n=1 Tax=Ixodes persulcatus TaxID=34615 RepID=A0AC60NYW4_IXOPE|nr:hypothetical protein HPB47_010497 [Ixodes persulcatus]
MNVRSFDADRETRPELMLRMPVLKLQIMASGGGGALLKALRPEKEFHEAAAKIQQNITLVSAGNELRVFLACDFLDEIFQAAGSKYQRDQLAKQHLPYVKPEEQVLDVGDTFHVREGLDVTKVSSARLRDAVFCAICLKEHEADGGLLRVNPEKNLIVTSTPSMDRAKKYNSISKICIASKTYKVTGYAAPPEDTAKEVIHNIPDYDTAEDITRSLVYKKNPTIIQAQRMGRSNSAVIVFEDNKVP